MTNAITNAGIELITSKLAANQVFTIDSFVLANVPGLDPSVEINLDELLPTAGYIVATLPVTASSFINSNQIVYSLRMDTTQGDFSFNWIGLMSGPVLVAIAYLPTQIKTKTEGALEGNNLTRNFVLAFSGAQAITSITIPAETWQYDFTNVFMDSFTATVENTSAINMLSLTVMKLIDRVKVLEQ